MDQTSRKSKAEIFCIALQPEGKKLLRNMGKPTEEGVPVVEKKVLAAAECFDIQVRAVSTAEHSGLPPAQVFTVTLAG